MKSSLTKNIFFALMILAMPMMVMAQEKKEEKQGLDKKIDKVFGDLTGWFVGGVFYQIPFGHVEDEITLDLAVQDKLKAGDDGVLAYSGKGVNYKVENDTLLISGVQLSGGQVAEKLESLSAAVPVKVKGASLAIALSDIQPNLTAKVKGSAPYTKVFWVLFPLILGAVYFTFFFKFINFTGFKTAINIVRGKYDELESGGYVDADTSAAAGAEDIPDTIRVEGHQEGEISHFQALTAALSATVGLGNIAGVAIAVSIGGAGATFWMIVAGFLGMASKFVECTLGVKFRDVDENGTVYGGPMYYLSKGFEKKGWGVAGKVLAVIFAIMCIGGSFGGGNMFQVNQAAQLFEHMTGGNESFIHGYRWVFGLVMAVLVGIVIIGGIKSIANVTDKIVPFMVAIYVLAAMFVLIMKYDQIGWAFGQIIDGAFSATGIAGGVVGVLVQGFRRAAFSNEAGIGSASIAHSAVKTNHAASEGLVALLEPFIDTVLVCTMTALVLIITGNVDAANAGLGNKEAILLTSGAFESVISWFPYVLTLAVLLFAFSTMISWSYYGYQAWSYLFGRSKNMEYLYKLIFCFFVIVGAAISLGSVIDFSDAMVFAMMVPNMIGLIFLAPMVKEELSKYMKAIKEAKL